MLGEGRTAGSEHSALGAKVAVDWNDTGSARMRARGVFAPPPPHAARAASPPADAAADEKTIVLHVFRDRTQARWKRVCVGALAALVVLGALAHLFLRSLASTRPNEALEGALPFDGAALLDRAAAVRAAPPPFLADGAAIPAASAPARAGRIDATFGWIDATEGSALASFAAHGASLTDVAVEAFHVDALGTLSAEPFEPALSSASERGVRVLLVVDAVHAGTPRPADVTALARNAARTARFAADLAARVEAARAAGVVLDLGEDEDDADGAARVAIVAAVRAAAPHRVVAVSARAGTSAAWLKRAGELADRVLVHVHLDPEDAPTPTPPAPRAWMEATIAAAAATVPTSKLVVLLPTRASAWSVRASDLGPRGTA